MWKDAPMTILLLVAEPMLTQADNTCRVVYGGNVVVFVDTTVEVDHSTLSMAPPHLTIR